MKNTNKTQVSLFDVVFRLRALSVALEKGLGSLIDFPSDSIKPHDLHVLAEILCELFSDHEDGLIAAIEVYEKSDQKEGE